MAMERQISPRRILISAFQPSDLSFRLRQLDQALRLNSDPNQRSSGLDEARIATIGVPIATMTARMAPQWVRSKQSTTQSPRSRSGELRNIRRNPPRLVLCE